MPSSKVISYIFFFFLILEIKNKSIFDGIKLGEKLPQVFIFHIFLSLILIRGNLLKS